jgi:potassium-transporting ATPase KdpC subunit
MQKIIVAIRAHLTLIVILGILYPLIITGIAQMVMPFEANGSLIEKEGKIIGSELIGQRFANPQYFHGRPSFADYDAINSGASNLGPTNKKLVIATTKEVQHILAENQLPQETQLPADMVLSSASGLDPHISLENAQLQAARVAKSRNLALTRVEKIIAENIDPDFIGIWGKSGVNVLKLNLMLDELAAK